MTRRLRAIRKDDSGFTLTELLIVIVILGVLTGIVVFAVGAFSDRGEKSACKAARKTTEVAVEAYRAKENKLPTAWADLQGGYLRSLPSVPDKYTIEVSWGPAGTGAVIGYLGNPVAPPAAPPSTTCDA